MRTQKFLIFLIFLELLCSFPVYSNDLRKASFFAITTNEGLSDGVVLSIEKDKWGYIWMGTFNGVNKYDGYKMVNYFHDLNDSSSLSHRQVNDIIMDKANRLWLGTNFGINLYNYDTDNFTRVKLRKKNGELIDPQVLRLYVDSEDMLWVLHDFTLYRVRLPVNKNIPEFLAVEHSYLSRELFGIDSAGFSGIIEDGSKRIWISAMNSTLASIDMISGRTEMIKIPYSKENINNSWDVKHLTFDTFHNRLVICSRYNGMALFTLEDKSFSFYTARNTSGMYNNLYESIVLSAEEIWLASDGTGITVFNNQKKNCYQVVKDINNPLSLNTSSVRAIYMDDKTNLWVGSSNRSGINIYAPYRHKFKRYFSSPDQKNTLNNNFTVGFYLGSQNDLWIATDGGGLNRMNTQTGNFTYYMAGPGSFRNNKILGVTGDKEGYIWTACWDAGVSRLDPLSGKVYNFIDYASKADIGKFSWPLYIFNDSRNNLWIAFNGYGLGFYDKKTNRIYHYPASAEVNGFPDNYPEHIYEDSKHNIWVSTYSGAAWFNLDEVDFSTTPPRIVFKKLSTNTQGKGLSFSEVSRITEDKKGNLWIGLMGNGLDWYDPINNKFKNYNTRHGLPGNSIKGLVCDDNNVLWVFTDKGLMSFNLNDSSKRVFGLNDGLLSLAASQNPYLSPDGDMYIPTTNGFNSFNPKKLEFNPNTVIPRITTLKIYDKPVEVGQKINDRVILPQHISDLQQITINYKEDFITLGYVAIDFNMPEKVMYRYMMEGFDKDWIHAGTRREATYTNLDPGKYIFKVMAANNDGLWNMEPTMLAITILPPWWATWWFRISLFTLIIGSAFGYYRFRVNALKREKRILETKVAERTAELSEANAQLEERQEEILAQKEELETKNEQVSRAYDNMQLLSDFGQRITATLNLEAINQMIYDYVSSLMDTQAFGLGIYNEKRKVIEFLHFVEDGKVLPYFTKELTSANSLSVRCFTNKEEIVIGNLSEEYKRYLTTLPEVQTKRLPVSMVHLPLVVEGRAIGTLTVNSFRADAYGPNELNNLRSLASYISIALDNASVYKVLRFTNEKVQNSIEYARTIQQAILPLREEMDKYFESFVLFRPKDVVSGDFYWMQVVDGAIYFAVVDCTGHGVPGAFMSLIGSRLLDEIVKEKDIRQPSQILEALDHELGIALRQEETENNDGMDVCLIKLEGEKLKVERGKIVEGKGYESNRNTGWALTFSGAMRPLYILQGKELIQLKGDRRSIGGKRTTRKTSISFIDQSMEIAAGTTLYLSSDGYSDQNNANHDKFGVLAYEKLLTDIASLSLDGQYAAMSQVLDAHIGNEEQRDDITVVRICLR